jgi:hypothetical protein
MSQTAKVVLALVAIVIGLVLVVGIVKSLITTVLSLLIPILILGAIGYAVYALVWKNNALGGGRRFLP